MRNAKQIIATLVLVGTLLMVGACPASAGSYSDARGLGETILARTRAHQALHRAERRYEEARHVVDQTRAFRDSYGMDVARWVWLAHDVGFPDSQLNQLMYVIRRESNGCPTAVNASSGASGLLQFLPAWWAGKWNPLDPRTNLSHGYRAWKACGWQPWAAY